ncbi:hypothetical protein HN51_007240 [Arachis hypogaea]
MVAKNRPETHFNIAGGTNLKIKFLKETKEMVAGNKPGTHFNKAGWINLKTKFLKETDLNYEYKQFKNKWETME